MEEKESKKKAKEETTKKDAAGEAPKEKAPKKEEKPADKAKDEKDAPKAEAKQTAGETKSAEGAPVVKRHKKSHIRVSSGIAHVHSTFNNTIVVMSDLAGKVICWASAGTCGFKGSRKSTPFAASVAAKQAAKKARDHGMSDITIRLKGPGPGKESAVRSLKSEGFNVRSIFDLTPTPHNGCRPRKKRRV